jgi:organic hydroperoxide reductase OsmC/OhrA
MKNETADLLVTAKKKTRFKAGTELTQKVNLVGGGKETDTGIEVSICVEVKTEEGNVIQLNANKNVRFKAESDLTGKVNLSEPQEEESTAETSCDLEIKLPISDEAFELMLRGVRVRKTMQDLKGIEKTDIRRGEVIIRR